MYEKGKVLYGSDMEDDRLVFLQVRETKIVCLIITIRPKREAQKVRVLRQGRLCGDVGVIGHATS